MSKLYESLQDINVLNEKRDEIKAKIADLTRQIVNYNTYIYHAKMNGNMPRVQLLTAELKELKAEKETQTIKLHNTNEKLVIAYQCVEKLSK